VLPWLAGGLRPRSLQLLRALCAEVGPVRSAVSANKALPVVCWAGT